MTVYCPSCFSPVPEQNASEAAPSVCPHCGEGLACANGATHTVHGRADSTATLAYVAKPTEGETVQRKTVGRFQVIKTLGSGGFGTVFLARDPELDRLVALKVPHAKDMAHSDFQERFRREARIAAQLHHPNIVRIHSVEQDGDLPFIVCEYVAGTTLINYVAQKTLTFRKIAEIVRDVLRALELAHSNGIVHRDVKLANILVEAGGTPRLADFGLSKRINTDITMTVEGQILGTPAYMSPEQASGDQEHVGPLSDIYSAGVVLYIMLTGELPFRGKPQMVVQQVLRDIPRSPKSLHDVVPLDLETICQKAMEKEPWRRYPSAAAMADDLDLWLQNRPICARHISRIGRLARWCRRNPVVASLVATVACLMIATATVSTYLLVREHTTLTKEYDRLNGLYVAQGTSRFEAQHPLGCPNPLAALPWLVSGLSMDTRNPARETVDRMRLEYVLKSCPKIEQMLFTDRPITFATFDPLGKRILTAGNESDALIWDAATGEKIVGPLKHEKAVLRGAFSPDGSLIATCSQDGTARVWNSQTGEPVTNPLSHQVDAADQTNDKVLIKICFSPNGKLLATVDLNRTVQIWECDSGKPACPPLMHKFNVLDVQFSPDGTRLLAAAGAERIARIWDVQTGKSLLDFYQHTVSDGHVYVARFSRDGAVVASGDNLGRVFLWNSFDGSLRESLTQQRGWITDLRFSPDGKTLAAATNEGMVSLWQVETGQQLGALITHARAVISIVFSPQGDVLATAGADGLVGLWDTKTGKGKFPPLPHGKSVTSVEFSPDGQRVLTASADGPVRVWDYRTPSPSTSPRSRGGNIECATVSADGSQFAAARADNVVVVVPVNEPLKETALEEFGDVKCLAFSHGASFLAAGGDDRTARVWNTASHQSMGPVLSHDAIVEQVALSHDARRLVTLTKRKEVSLWDVPAGTCLSRPLAHGCPVTEIVMSPRGHEFATVGGSTICLWNSESGTAVGAPLTHEEEVLSASFHPQSTLLLSTGENGATLWNRTGSSWRATPLLAGGAVQWAGFSPDGMRVATVTWTGTAQIWNCRDKRPSVAAMRHPALIHLAAFSPDGRYLLTCTADRQIRLWDVLTGFLVIPSVPVTSDVKLAIFNPQSGSILALCNDGPHVIAELAAEPRPFDELKRLAELRAAHTVDAVTGSTPLSPSQLFEAWTKTQTIRGPAQ